MRKNAYYVDLSHMNAAIGAPTDLTDNFATDDQPKWGETGGHPGHAGVAPVAAPAHHRSRAPRR